MKAPRVQKPGVELRAALEALGGEASVHQLWVKTRLPKARIDKVLNQSPWAERSSRASRSGQDVEDRRWRIKRPA